MRPGWAATQLTTTFSRPVRSLVSGVVPLVAIAIAIAIAMSGCTAAVESETALGGGASGASKSFSGPWANLFESAYADAFTEQERSALDDGQIDGQEYAYFQNRIVECLSAKGIKEAIWASDGALSYKIPNGADEEAVNTCNRENGLQIIALKDAIDRNPDQLDENEIMVACLKRIDLVDAGYTTAMYAAGTDLSRYINSDEFAKCDGDPLNYATE